MAGGDRRQPAPARRADHATDGSVVLGGGLPILVDGRCIGGVGVSGGSEEQDEACARAALAALGLNPAE